MSQTSLSQEGNLDDFPFPTGQEVQGDEGNDSASTQSHTARGKGRMTNLVAVKYFTPTRGTPDGDGLHQRLVTPVHPTLLTAPSGSDAEVAVVFLLR